MAARRRSPAAPRGGEHATERSADQDDAIGIDLGTRRQCIDHARHHILPIGTHGQASVVEHRSLARAVHGGEGIAAIERWCGRGVQLLGGAVVAANVEDQGSWLIGPGRDHEIPREFTGKGAGEMVEEG
jgi:hypothetical protein